jgi:hypothetical protein
VASFTTFGSQADNAHRAKAFPTIVNRYFYSRFTLRLSRRGGHSQVYLTPSRSLENGLTRIYAFGLGSSARRDRRLRLFLKPNITRVFLPLFRGVFGTYRWTTTRSFVDCLSSSAGASSVCGRPRFRETTDSGDGFSWALTEYEEF